MGSEAAYQSAPSSVGPYTVITRPDTFSPGVPLPEERFIARSRDGARTVLLSVPVPGADPERFVAEAEASRYLLGPWASPAAEVSQPGEAAWHARPYLPAVPLPTALAVYGGPLPVHTVRALGACLAETLAVAHGQGLTHAGVSPGAVLLAADGPRLGCFGAVRAAAPDGEARSGRAGLESGSLPPEQVLGDAPQPPGDLYALGATLAYAATGHTVPERQELPASLREIVAGCLSRDPGARPRAGEVISALIEPEGPRDGAPHTRTAHAVVDSAPRAHAGVKPTPGWLPGRLTAALARQSAEILAAETAATETAPPVPTAVTPQARKRARAQAQTEASPEAQPQAQPQAAAASHAPPPVPPAPPVPSQAGDGRLPGVPGELPATRSPAPTAPATPHPAPEAPPPSGRPVNRNRPE